jgi:BASS family bile acid:Na+ symporter
MASGLAGSMGKLGTVGLADVVFSPWMNISESLLANYWRRKPIVDKEGMNEYGSTNLKLTDLAKAASD